MKRGKTEGRNAEKSLLAINGFFVNRDLLAISYLRKGGRRKEEMQKEEMRKEKMRKKERRKRGKKKEVLFYLQLSLGGVK